MEKVDYLENLNFYFVVLNIDCIIFIIHQAG